MVLRSHLSEPQEKLSLQALQEHKHSQNVLKPSTIDLRVSHLAFIKKEN